MNRIDKKGRVSVPAPFRTAVATEVFPGIILYRSYKVGAIEGCALSWMERLSQSVESLDLFGEDQDNLAATIFADAHQMSFDGDGRVTLPESLIAHAGLTEKVAFVGRGSTFQLWTPKAFEQHQAQARETLLKTKPKIQLAGK